MHFVVGLLVILVNVAYLHDDVSSESVVELSSDNIEGYVKEHKLVLTLFYAPWCGHCKKLMPDYVSTCEDVRSNLPKDVLCGRLDCTKNENVCQAHQLKGYPTIKILKAGGECEYVGERTKEGIYTWLTNVIDASTPSDDFDKLQSIFAATEHVLVAYFEPGHEQLKMIDTLSCSLNFVKIAVISDASLAEKIGITAKNAFHLFEKGVFLKSVEYSDSPSVFKKELWVATTPSVPAYSHEGSMNVFNEAMKHYIAFLHDTADSLSSHEKTLKEYATLKGSAVRVFTVDVSKADNKNVVDYFSVKTFPKVVFYNDETSVYHHYEGSAISVETLDGFYMGCLNGSISRHLKRQPIPEDWDSKAVKILVVDNFEEALKKYKQGIVLFYAPWCGHCEALMPTWEELGQLVSSKYADKDVFVGKIDHTQNEMPSISVSGYPTIYAFKTGSEPVMFKGERTIKSFEEFIVKTFMETADKPSEDQQAPSSDTVDEPSDEL